MDLQRPVPTTELQPPVLTTKPTIRYPIGTIVRKNFNDKYYEGEIIAYDVPNKYYKVHYRDGDIEELESGDGIASQGSGADVSSQGCCGGMHGECIFIISVSHLWHSLLPPTTPLPAPC